MPFSYEEITSLRADDFAFSYSDTQMLLYNLSVGMGRDPCDAVELPYVFESPELKVLPSAATVLVPGLTYSVMSNSAGVMLPWLYPTSLPLIQR